MVISADGLALENEFVKPNGQPTLGAAFEAFHGQWKSGQRDRELALHLMFAPSVLSNAQTYSSLVFATHLLFSTFHQFERAAVLKAARHSIRLDFFCGVLLLCC